MDLERGHREDINGQKQSRRANLRYLVKILTIGFHLGSALASYILFGTQVWSATLAVFFISSAALMLQKHKEVKSWGPITVLIAIVFGLVLYGSAQQETLDFRPFLTIITTLLLYLTVFGLPRIHQALYPDLIEDLNSTVGNHTDGPQWSLPGTPGLLQVLPGENIRVTNTDIQRTQLIRDHEVSNMSHRSQSGLSQRYSDTSSDIDIEPPESTSIALRRVMRRSQDLDIDELLRMGYQKGPRPRFGAPPELVGLFQEAGPPNGPETADEPVPVSTSGSANSNSPLL